MSQLREDYLKRLNAELNKEEAPPALLEVVRKTLNDLGELKTQETEERDPEVVELERKYRLLEGDNASKTG